MGPTSQTDAPFQVRTSILHHQLSQTAQPLNTDMLSQLDPECVLLDSTVDMAHPPKPAKVSSGPSPVKRKYTKRAKSGSPKQYSETKVWLTSLTVIFFVKGGEVHFQNILKQFSSLKNLVQNFILKKIPFKNLARSIRNYASHAFFKSKLYHKGILA